MSPKMLFNSLPAFICLVFSSIVSNDAARILAVFPVPSISHQVVFRPLTLELAKRGHELVVLTTDPVYPKGKAPANFTELDFHDLSYGIWVERSVKMFQGTSGTSLQVLEAAYRILTEIFEEQIQTKEVQDLFKSKQHFDLIITEACVRVATVMSHVFKAPLIQMSSFAAVPPNLQVMGAPSHPIYYPEASRKRIHELSLWEKIQGAYEDYTFRNIQWRLEDSENEMIKKNFGPDAPTVAELGNNVDMLFLNVDSVWDNNRPVPPGVIYLGGLHQNPQKELPKELKSFLDGSKHGVIYMSFGTNVQPSQLPPEKIQVFTKVFSKLPYDVLWKFDKDDIPGKSSNVRISKWLPQSDLLRHPNIKLFITQGGLQSTDESLTAGVPLIAFPMLGDQWFNGEKYVELGIGMKFEIETVEEDVLTEAINNVIKNKSYRDNIKRLNTLIRDKPQSPLEKAVWWTEYAIRHGGAKHLRSAAANICWGEYLMLDVVAVILGAVFAVLGLIVLLVPAMRRKLCVGEKVKRN